MQEFDNDVCLLYYLKIIKTLRSKESDLRLVEISSLCLLINRNYSLFRCITFYEELMLMKEFERTENDLENKVNETQQRFDNEQIKVNFNEFDPIR